MKTFIVHIYTCKKTDTRNLVGVVEEVGCEGKKAFTNPEDLLKIMSYKEMKNETDEHICS
jgi:hypothetical protein